SAGSAPSPSPLHPLTTSAAATTTTSHPPRRTDHTHPLITNLHHRCRRCLSTWCARPLGHSPDGRAHGFYQEREFIAGETLRSSVIVRPGGVDARSVFLPMAAGEVGNLHRPAAALERFLTQRDWTAPGRRVVHVDVGRQSKPKALHSAVHHKLVGVVADALPP